MVASANAPIGVFDSGIGGLTVAREIMRHLPHESVVYFGDTARVPYGPKSPETVRRYSREIATFLEHEGVKAIVVACNTATAHALPMLRERFSLPVIGVVQPGARAAVQATRTRRVAVIGTTGTIQSGAYERAIQALDPDVVVTALACPLFAPFVEEGWTNHEAIRLVAREYLSSLIDEATRTDANAIDTLVLGCTHYPLLKPMLANLLGERVRLIDSAAETALEAARVLAERQLLTENGARPTHRFFASDDPTQFLQLGRRFLGGTVEGVEVHTFG